MTTITKRVDDSVTESLTNRVPTSGASIGATGNDTWDGTWGLNWGLTWFNLTVGSEAVPSPIITSRVSGVPSEGITKRVGS